MPQAKKRAKKNPQNKLCMEWKLMCCKQLPGYSSITPPSANEFYVQVSAWKYKSVHYVFHVILHNSPALFSVVLQLSTATDCLIRLTKRLSCGNHLASLFLWWTWCCSRWHAEGQMIFIKGMEYILGVYVWCFTLLMWGASRSAFRNKGLSSAVLGAAHSLAVIFSCYCFSNGFEATMWVQCGQYTICLLNDIILFDCIIHLKNCRLYWCQMYVKSQKCESGDGM